MKYYNSEKIDKKDATYNVIFGERSNGKTHNALIKGLKNYVKDGSQLGYVRRWKEEVRGRRASALFSSINEMGLVSKITGGEFTGVHYANGKFYLCTYSEAGKAIFSDGSILGYIFALSDVEHDKSTSYPLITLIIFDEFLTNKLYLPDEFVLFMNVVSTIVRRREDVKIYMLGNTVNKFCPYFKEMGLLNVEKMVQGSIDIYRYGLSSLTVAVEYCETSKSKEEIKSNKYFAFNNPKLQMITGGAWELSIYPHLPEKYQPKHVLSIFFIEFGGKMYQGNVVMVGDNPFIYIHNKTTELKDLDSDLVYSLEYSHRRNFNRNIYNPSNKLQKFIASLFAYDKIFYQDNDVGNAVSNYIKACKRV